MRRLSFAVLLAALAVLAPAPARAQSSQSQALLADWYWRFLNRAPDAVAANWAVTLDQGQSPEKLLATIMGTPECYIRAGGTPESYVRAMFQDLTGRQPTPAEYQFWLGRLLNSGGEQPDQDDRTDLAYAMILRYPQVAEGPSPYEAPPPAVAPPAVEAPPAVVVPDVRGRDWNDWDRRDDYEYHRPIRPAIHWDHHDEHHDDHHDHHDEHRR